jgi:uncharacterized protein
MALRAFLVLLGVLAITVPRPAAAGTEELEWGEWSTGVFARAKAENRFVLLDLGAVWCHWCHVMEETTYRDPAIVRLIRSRYLPIRVDQDANPDLSNRYEDYGWPATIVFAPNGTELAKRRGYLPPEQFAALLQAFIDDPKPGPSVVPARVGRRLSVFRRPHLERSPLREDNVLPGELPARLLTRLRPLA